MYTGLWKRESIAFDDSEPQETATVFWLQGEKYFADLRIPLDQPQIPARQSLEDLEMKDLLMYANFSSFGGNIDATENWIRWNHGMNFLPRPGQVDQGNVFWQDGNLIEDGQFESFQDLVRYREVWVPQALGDTNLPNIEIFEPGQHLLVVLGEHFIHLQDGRSYAPEFSVPEVETLSEAQLRHLLRFRADYGHRDPKIGTLAIRLSSDPTRVGQVLSLEDLSVVDS
jgi:Protein HRI1